MAVDQQQRILVVALLAVSGQVNLADHFERELRKVGFGGKTVIGRRYKYVVDIQQKTATGSLSDRADEIRLAHRRGCKRDIGRRILKQDRTLDHILHLANVFAYLRQRV